MSHALGPHTGSYIFHFAIPQQVHIPLILYFLMFFQHSFPFKPSYVNNVLFYYQLFSCCFNLICFSLCMRFPFCVSSHFSQLIFYIFKHFCKLLHDVKHFKDNFRIVIKIYFCHTRPHLKISALLDLSWRMGHRVALFSHLTPPHPPTHPSTHSLCL
jgi:hypothetical protein